MRDLALLGLVSSPLDCISCTILLTGSVPCSRRISSITSDLDCLIIRLGPGNSYQGLSDHGRSPARGAERGQGHRQLLRATGDTDQRRLAVHGVFGRVPARPVIFHPAEGLELGRQVHLPRDQVQEVEGLAA